MEARWLVLVVVPLLGGACALVADLDSYHVDEAGRAAGSSVAAGGGAARDAEQAGGNSVDGEDPEGPGGSALCAETPCKLTLPQCGCDADLQCGLEGSQRSCVAVTTVALGQPCEDDCAAGHACFSVASNGPSICRPFCETDDACSGPGARCVLQVPDGRGGVVPAVRACSRDCNPITNAGCGVASMACQLASDAGGNVFTLCSISGAGGQEASCSSSSQCQQGFVCANSQCLKVCDPRAVDCPGATSCMSPPGGIVLGDAAYGLCFSGALQP